MKKILLLIPLFLLLIGCSSRYEDDKFSYLEYKNNLERQETFDDGDNLDFNTFFYIDRDGDNINYSLTINNPTKDMKDIKALLINDYNSDDVYPSIGIFDEAKTIYKGSNDNITLKGTIVSADDISNVRFKLYLEYINADNQKEEIYYEVQRG